MNANKFLKNFIVTAIICAISLSMVGCGNLGLSGTSESSGKNSSEQQFSQSAQQNSVTSSATNSVTDSSSQSHSVTASSSSSHTHDYSEKVVDEKFLKTEATYLDCGEYYYSCSCGEIGTETFKTDVQSYDYSEIDDYINMILTKGSYENPFWNTEKTGSATWNYIDGCMMTSLIKLYDLTKESKYYDFVNAFMNYLIKSDGTMLGYSMSDYNLDNLNEGRVLFYMYQKKGSQKYKTAIETLNKQILNQPTTSLGSFWHKKKYTNQVWLDGLYMAQPFYAQYQLTFGDGDVSNVLKQFENVEKYMKDSATGLYYHGFDVTKSVFWADKTTGLSQSFWLRSIGWYLAALSDMTTILDKDSDGWKQIQGYLQNAVDSVLAFMDDETHMFYQVVDKGATTDKNGKSNYLETSGTALIAYSILNAVNSGALSNDYLNVGKSIFNGICINKLSKTKDGEFELSGICKVAGLGPESSPERDGSFEYYLSEPVVSNEAKGVAPFIMAYVEILRSQQA